jgi:hypothetical protein
MLCYREQEEEHAQGKKHVNSQVGRVKEKTDESEPSALVNMVFILPMEFKAPSDEEEEERADASCI